MCSALYPWQLRCYVVSMVTGFVAMIPWQRHPSWARVNPDWQPQRYDPSVLTHICAQQEIPAPHSSWSAVMCEGHVWRSGDPIHYLISFTFLKLDIPFYWMTYNFSLIYYMATYFKTVHFCKHLIWKFAKNLGNIQ